MVVRHGETDWNRGWDESQGWEDDGWDDGWPEDEYEFWEEEAYVTGGASLYGQIGPVEVASSAQTGLAMGSEGWAMFESFVADDGADEEEW